MSRSSRKESTVQEKKASSLQGLLDKPKKLKSNCTLLNVSEGLPCIEESRRRKSEEKCSVSESGSSTSMTPHWLKPGISLPRMHGANRSGGDAAATPVHSGRVSRVSTERSGRSGRSGRSSRDSKMEQPSFGSKKSSATESNSPGGCFLRNRVNSDELTGDNYLNVVGPRMCQSSFEVAKSDTDSHFVAFDDTVFGESKQLKNWERWMNIRKRQNDLFSAKLKRDRCQLVMNTAEDLRKINEEKLMHSCARIGSPDKWRGNPYFWKKPVKLPMKGSNKKYIANDTLPEKGIVPKMEFVSVPDAIKKEKDVFCPDYTHSKSRGSWVNSEYRQEQREKYKKRFLIMEPHHVEGNELIVIGQKIQATEENEISLSFDIPTIEVTSFDDEKRSKQDGGQPDERLCDAVHGVMCLAINDVELKINLHDGVDWSKTVVAESNTWSLVFETAPAGKITEKVLRVENRGTVAIGYYWQLGTPKEEFAMFPRRKTLKSGRYFYFDKNPGIFLPGQITDIKFYHHSKNVGYHTENWYLKLNPNLFGQSRNGRVRLVAVAENIVTHDDLLKIDAYLNSCVAQSVVRQTVEEIFERLRPEISANIEYRSLFIEEELFEFHNPSHYYRHDVVVEMKKLFAKLPLDPPQDWDLSVLTLEQMIRTLVEGKPQHEMLCRLMELTRLLLRPSNATYRLDRKYIMVYNSLCAAMDAIEENGIRLKAIFKMSDVAQQEEIDETTPSEAMESNPNRSQESFQLELHEEESIAEEKSATERTLDEISIKDVMQYSHFVRCMIFNCLCDAVEDVAGIVESCKLFEHHGEILPALRKAPQANNDSLA